jgi:hypothetical protein
MNKVDMKSKVFPKMIQEGFINSSVSIKVYGTGYGADFVQDRRKAND